MGVGGGGGATPPPPPPPGLAPRLLALILEGLQPTGVKEEAPTLQLLVALGTLCVLGHGKAAKGVGLVDCVDSLLGRAGVSPTVKEAACDAKIEVMKSAAEV